MPWQASGYPLVVTLENGSRIVLDLPEPGYLANLDSSQIGLAVISPNGRVRTRWGHATTIELLKPNSNLLDSELSNLISMATREGGSDSLYLDGKRYYVSTASKFNRKGDLLLLVVDADEERRAKEASTLQARSAEVLRRIGKALTMHQTLSELAVLAVHEIASAAELAAVLLWARTSTEERLTLRAHVGVSRQGASAVHSLEPSERLSCAAELVANRRQMLWVHDVAENMMTRQLEAKFCYLNPKQACVLPLIVGDRVIGVLELVGRDGDIQFQHSKELFEVIAEHLSLAVNTCSMFESVERLATHDPMTGVANHRTLQSFLSARVNESERNGTQLGVVMLDVDHFRSFNEEEGHDAGDLVLKKVAEAIKETIRPYDLAARYGGEEFSIIMPGLNLDYTREVAERIRKRIEEIDYVTATGRTRHVTASLGVSSYPLNARDPAGLLKAADTALFRAKRAGRNRVEVFDGTMMNDALTQETSTDWASEWMTAQDKAISNALFEKVKPFMQYVGRAMSLSKAQCQILEDLVMIYPTYQRLMSMNDLEVMRKMELAQEFRPLLPSLMTLDERFDGTGPMKMKGAKIPVLSRILSVLLAIAKDNGRPLLHDRERFDPEIVALIADVQEAA